MSNFKDVHVAPWQLQECVEEDVGLHSYGLLAPRHGVEDISPPDQLPGKVTHAALGLTLFIGNQPSRLCGHALDIVFDALLIMRRNSFEWISGPNSFCTPLTTRGECAQLQPPECGQQETPPTPSWRPSQRPFPNLRPWPYRTNNDMGV